MRTFFLVSLAFAILLGGFLVTMRVMSKPVDDPSNKTITESPTRPLQRSPKNGQMPPGEVPWYAQYDVNGRLTNKFRGTEYTPGENGRIGVSHPEAWFYIANGQKIRVLGTTGEVEMPTTATKTSGINFTGGGAPKRGGIHTVTIELYNLYPDSNDKVPDETMTTDNINFDNETMLITAEEMEPVHVRATTTHPGLPPTRGYDLEGKGLRLRWNNKDGRLDLLEIAHGQWLKVYDTSSSSGLFGTPQHAPKTQSTSMAPLVALAGREAQPLAASPINTPPPPTSIEPSPPAHEPSQPSANAIQASATISPSVKAEPPPVPVPYQATFLDNVRITQGKEILITADRMDVDFVSRQQQQPPTTAPTTQKVETSPTGKSLTPGTVIWASSTPQAGAPADSQPTVVAHAESPATQPATRPTTRPAPEPMIIYWTGKLHMAPAQRGRPKLAPGDSVVDLTTRPFDLFMRGFPALPNPVTVFRQPIDQPEGDFVCAARVIYHTGDGGVKLSHSATLPQVLVGKLHEGKPDLNSAITTDTLDYPVEESGKKYAKLTGAGHALMPTESTAAKAGHADKTSVAMMDARWKKSANVYFVGKGQQDQMAIEHVDLAGDVDVQHPQLAMQSQALSLFFEPPPVQATLPANATARPQQELKTVIATQAVHCDMLGQNKKKQTIDCEQLIMKTARSADGKFYAKTVNTRGNVHAFDGEQDLRGGFVDLTMKPAKTDGKKTAPGTQPAKQDSDTAQVELDTMHARDHVHVVNKDGSIATGADLTITTEDDQQHVRLAGSMLPAADAAERTATVIDAKKNVIVGPVITFEPKDSIAHIVGPGTMHVLQEQAGQGAPRPMDVKWIERADMDGSKDRVDVTGAVAIRTIDSDGTINDVTGNHVHIDLVKKVAPATRPAQPATAPTTRPTDTMQMSVMKDKDMRSITIDGDAQIISTLWGPAGTPARQMAMFAPKIIYDLLDAKQQPAKMLTVPSAGRMLVSDHRPPETKKAPKADNQNDESSSRGDTAFKWGRKMVYTEQGHEAIMNGDVFVKHRPDGKDASEIIVQHADQVTATFEPQKPATRPVGVAVIKPPPAADPGSSMQLKHLVADGNVQIDRAGGTLFANQVDYDPISHWMIARGSENHAARYEDPDPKRSMTAQQLEWNTQTWNIKMTDPKSSHPK